MLFAGSKDIRFFGNSQIWKKLMNRIKKGCQKTTLYIFHKTGIERNGVLPDYPQYSSDTLSFFLPLARREANTRRPLAVAILERNPCLFFLFLLEG